MENVARILTPEQVGPAKDLLYKLGVLADEAGKIEDQQQPLLAQLNTLFGSAESRLGVSLVGREYGLGETGIVVERIAATDATAIDVDALRKLGVASATLAAAMVHPPEGEFRTCRVRVTREFSRKRATA